MINNQTYNYINGFTLTEEDGTANQLPVANAGQDKEITLPSSTINLSGMGNDADGSIVSYDWRQIAGPSGVAFSSTNVPSPLLSNLAEGTYVFGLNVKDNGGATSFEDTVIVVVKPAVLTVTRFIKVNLYGGTNAYNSAAWNNWNVKSSLSSGLLKYADGSSSVVSCVFSHSTAIIDNGATYGGVMAPPQVLRYASSFFGSRSLTLKGLDTSKKYGLELYGTRNATSGTQNVYSIPGFDRQGVSTYQNLFKTAFFGSYRQPVPLMPDSLGQIVVTISNLQEENTYLNGFTLLEYVDAPNQMPVANAGADTVITHPDFKLALNGSAVDVDGSIIQYQWYQIPPSTLYLGGTFDNPKNVYEFHKPGTYTFVLRVFDNSGGIDQDTTTIVINPEPEPTITKYIKVNVLGRYHHYYDIEWNNFSAWSTNLSTRELRYSNGLFSKVSAQLSRADGGHDNELGYGSGMAPAGVLRHTSSATGARTLTLSGLYPSKTYHLELYASRANTGNSTTFTAGGNAVTVITDYNLTNKASFVNLVPTADGRLVIGIANVNSYNYLNGFILTENGYNSNAQIVSSQEVSKLNEVTLNELQLQAFPNPSAGIFTLSIKSSHETPLLITVRDAVGRVVERAQHLPVNGIISIGQDYRPGMYFAEVVQGGERIIIKLVKTAR